MPFVDVQVPVLARTGLFGTAALCTRVLGANAVFVRRSFGSPGDRTSLHAGCLSWWC